MILLHDAGLLTLLYKKQLYSIACIASLASFRHMMRNDVIAIMVRTYVRTLRVVHNSKSKNAELKNWKLEMRK